jgi:hypothetical protein
LPSEGLEDIDELPTDPPSLRTAYRQAIRAMDANAFEAPLNSLSALVVRQADDEQIEEHGDQRADGEVVNYLVPRLRVRHDPAEPGVRTHCLSRKRVFIRQKQRCDAQNGDRYERYIKKTFQCKALGALILLQCASGSRCQPVLGHPLTAIIEKMDE